MGTLLPPTSPDLQDPAATPYFVWWTPCTVRDLRAHLASDDADERAYWLGVLLREANSRDVWLFTTVAEIRAAWPLLQRHLGRTRERWAWLLDLPLSAHSDGG
ncbi:MAG: hypothetical protein IT379_34125 [Deltaproteobacteria bacterium]|nr:hypothetical protein [Deltaproteobacteria bacterium]